MAASFWNNGSVAGGTSEEGLGAGVGETWPAASDTHRGMVGSAKQLVVHEERNQT